MARPRKRKPQELPPQPDPRAPLDVGRFLAAARAVLAGLTDDLLARADESPAVTAALLDRHADAVAQGLTGDAYPVWRRGVIVQVAAAWLLSCVFVRTLEDRGLLGRNRLAGPGAVDSQRSFARLAPQLGLREYLLTIFAELERLPAARALFDRGHNLVWLLGPSPAGARALVELFRAGDPERPQFRFGAADTRFLGDLYQDLSEDVRRRYALLQTPEFVEAFILDRTLEPAIDEFGLAATELIDPTCGSGHFLLGAFERLFARRRAAEPGRPVAAHVGEALAAVHGIDLNPYAVAIARFRLILAAAAKLGLARLGDAPALPVQVEVGDSLLSGPARRFAAVVGNPPYITVKDAALREQYRSLYNKTAYREYSLAAPFMQRFFELARPGGFVGEITANSFMKREFGKRLIEEYLPGVDLQLVINTAGAHIPGHGTPTVLLFGRARAPTSATVHVVLARRGEPSPPTDPAAGRVWSSIRARWHELGFEDEYITVAALDRGALARHPWSLEGGGAAELEAALAAASTQRLADLVAEIGVAAVTREDEAYVRGEGPLRRLAIPDGQVRPLVAGEDLRDWACLAPTAALCPYDPDELAPLAELPAALERCLWPVRRRLAERVAFGRTQLERGLPWYEYSMLFAARLRAPLRIAFAEVATHNHFVLDRGGKLFKQTAPIITLPESADEDDHLALLAYLNSSTAEFCMKQRFFDKGNRGEGGGITAEPWEKFYQRDATKLASLPVPPLVGELRERLIGWARELTELAAQRAALTGEDAFERADEPSGLRAALDALREQTEGLQARMRALQERIDWAIYRAFGLCEEPPSCPERLAAGQRYVDRVAAREAIASGNHRYFQMCRYPAPEQILASRESPYIEAAARLVAGSDALALLEQPRYKRSYREGFRPLDLAARARAWLRRRGERRFAAQAQPQIQTAAELHAALDCPAVRAVCVELLEREWSPSLAAELLTHEAAPFVAAARLSEAGLDKRAVWRRCWALQRRADAGEAVAIPIPPKFASKDFRSPGDYRVRGRLDLGNERFISYPGCEPDGDPQPLLGWAGWDHAERAEALLALYELRRERDGWSGERLIPLLAGIFELLEWIEQWHDDPDPETGERLGAAYREWLGEALREQGLTREDLDRWRPASAARRNNARRRRQKRVQ